MGTKEILQLLRPLTDLASKYVLPLLNDADALRIAFDTHVHKHVPFLPHASVVLASVLVVRFVVKAILSSEEVRLQARRLGHGHIWRNVESFSALRNTPAPGLDTLATLFKHSVERYPDSNCLGTRETLKIEDEEQPDGKKFEKETRGEYKWLTYKQTYEQVCALAQGIRALGVNKGQNIAVFADTKAEFQILAQACFQHGIVMSTIYATLGEEALIHAINETEVTVVFTDPKLVSKLGALYKDGKIPRVEHIVSFGDCTKFSMGKPGAASGNSSITEADIADMKVDDLKEALTQRSVRVPSGARKAELQELLRNSLKSSTSGITTHTFEEIQALGRTQKFEIPEVKPDDLAVIMYTSGSTGLPKGVCLSHKNLIACVSGAAPMLPNLNHSDVYIAYLPLAHVLELMAETAVLSVGASLGYAKPLTLTDNSTAVKAGTKGDITVLRPTLMACVPAIMERVRKAVNAKIEKSSPLARKIFNLAFNYKLGVISKGGKTPILDLLIFKKTRDILGGRVRIVLSGGAPLAPETQSFMNVCFSCPIGQGYGLTETCGGGTICRHDDFTTGRVGPPISCAEIRLVSWEEGGYSVNDTPHPRGEVVIGGDHVAVGYYKNEKKTAEDFREEHGQRWFYTGDIGEMQEDGCLKIVDRKKDLVKLQHGEYVSLGKVESTLQTCKSIAQVCIVGNSQSDYVVGLIVPQEPVILSMGKDLGISGSFAELCANKKIVDAVMADINQVSKTNKLHRTEIPKKIFLTPNPWTPESNLVTAALKLKRTEINKEFAQQIAAMYKGSE